MAKTKNQTKTEPPLTIEQILAALPTFSNSELFDLMQSIICHIRERRTELDPAKLFGVVSAAFHCYKDRTTDE
jgi:hypothetical protein